MNPIENNIQESNICDQSLLALLTAEDIETRQQGWQAWYERDNRNLHTYVSRRCRDIGCSAQSEDIVQDAFMIAFKNMEAGKFTYQGKALCGYLHGISKYLIYDLLRQCKREVLEEFEIDWPQQNAIKLEDQVHMQDVLYRIVEACQKLAPGQYAIVAGLYAQGRTAQELSKELQKSAANIRTIATRTIKTICSYLAKRYQLDIAPKTLRLCLQHL